MSVDKSDEADARRFRWLFTRNGYLFEEEFVINFRQIPPRDLTEEDADKVRLYIDEAMAEHAKSIESLNNYLLEHARSLIEFWQPKRNK